MKSLLYFLITTMLLTTTSCEKQDNNPAEFFIKCKIDGQDYRPNGCANCMKGQILRDTVFLMNANADLQSVGLGFYDGSGVQIKTYILNGTTGGSADYKNSTTTNDKFRTDATHNGNLVITSLDKVNKIIAGTFYFQGYNAVQNKTVNITNGEFKLKYTDY